MQELIVLVGPMGSGKTTLGRKLAKARGLNFVDTDKMVAAENGAITKIFEQFGEEYFRDLEASALRRALSEDGIVATGGGVVIRESNRDMLKGNRVIFLDTASEHVLGKINLTKRPLLKDNPERWQELYESRLPLYKEVSTHTVFTGGKGIRTLMKELEKVISNG